MESSRFNTTCLKSVDCSFEINLNPDDLLDESAAGPSGSTLSTAAAETNGKMPWKSHDCIDDAPSTHGYNFWLEGTRLLSDPVTGKDTDRIRLQLASQVNPACRGYALLSDYKITAGLVAAENRTNPSSTNEGPPFTKTLFVEMDLIHESDNGSGGSDETPFLLEFDTPEQILECEDDSIKMIVRFELRVREILSGTPQDLHDEAPYRDFALLVCDTAFYVNVNYLSDLGSPYFKKMEESRAKGVRRTVLLNRDIGELRVFFNGLCTYRQPVITVRNLDIMIELSKEFEVSKALRACERYLLESTKVHPIRKLEYAAEYGLGILADTVLRQLGTELECEAALDEYLLLSGESRSNMHPDVLAALGITDEYVITN